jgi:hypothetical protein
MAAPGRSLCPAVEWLLAGRRARARGGALPAITDGLILCFALPEKFINGLDKFPPENFNITDSSARRLVWGI